jgi:hypothetical protein
MIKLHQALLLLVLLELVEPRYAQCIVVYSAYLC